MDVEPDVALLLARAATIRGNQALARQHLDDLDAGMIDGRGWGLSYAWDAFSDGIINPASTIYTYTTAAAVHAHLDYAERFARPLPPHVLVAAETLKTLWPYYDDQPNDQQSTRIVYNVNALSLATQHRIHGSVDRARLYALLLAQGDWWRTKIATKEGVPVAKWCWPYSTALRKPNDMFHELLLCDGLLHMGSTAREAAIKSIRGVWETHLHGVGRARDGVVYTLGSLLWGPAIATVVLHRAGMIREAQQTFWNALSCDLYGATHPRALAWYEVASAQLEDRAR